ncbi:hypothetical protein EES44_22600 [Streptomyces sp. ADI96-15]|uniref:hypothetical protein n=1 Tax=Streptomyces TaxID=1883 RepID=UPI0003C3126A|nr:MULTISPECIES: hypothetical protein [Streptomyces]QOZ99023.1 hypothetical protein DI273_07630 [Streptomyces violascens]ESP99527.1 hypothetical protein B591_07415 [Streptomyces sp. GBA 94-10 4N24]ESQ05575.1 hypothetical protein B590_07490 [Streptomyces sp. PVA_94-07]RPK59403.1 hypothetical protein EES44_22600 [Streptomyces sp. ADI96-15]RWZ77703.1 hypothetical protein EQK42_01440 [Streptomyces albidoflavus]
MSALASRLRLGVAAAAAATLLAGGSPGTAAPAPAPFGKAALPADPGTRDHPYVFTQQHRDGLWWWNGTWLPQSVPPGAHLQIQLPAGPAHWEPVTGRACRPTGAAGLLPVRARATALGTSVLPNEGRIDGFSTLEVFDYRVEGIGAAAICLRANPRPERPGDIGLPDQEPLVYVLTVLVRIPQASLPRL